MELKDKRNAYTCTGLAEHVTLTINRADGVTPFIIRCPKCGKDSQSHCYRLNVIDQFIVPSHEWVKLDTDELRLSKILAGVARAESEEYNPTGSLLEEQVTEWIDEHASNGGLFLREIATGEWV